ncbi:MAG TPA: hypothetical protein VHC70_06570 [Phycisphaerales bacterium]|nr:hypothetical protein [Phycisphaerales bacterium]
MERLCSKCGYDCTGVAGDVCPECGRATIMPSWQGVRVRQDAQVRLAQLVLLAVVTGIPPAVCIFALLWYREPLVIFGLILALAIMSPGALLFIATLVAHNLRPPLTRRQENVRSLVAVCSWGWIVLALLGDVWWLLHVFA